MGSWEDFDRLTRFIGHNPEKDISRLVCGTIAFTLAFVLIVQIPSLRLISGESVARRLLLFAVQTFSIYTFFPNVVLVFMSYSQLFKTSSFLVEEIRPRVDVKAVVKPRSFCSLSSVIFFDFSPSTFLAFPLSRMKFFHRKPT